MRIGVELGGNRVRIGGNRLRIGVWELDGNWMVNRVGMGENRVRVR